jgi:signal transduction histidine kinase
MEGANYLEVCGRAIKEGDEYAERALFGLESVLKNEAETFSMEYPCSSPDEERWFILKVVPLRLPEGGCVISHTDITAWKEAERGLQDSQRALRESREDYRSLARQLLSAQEDARRQLARELHDDLSQRLAVVSIEAGKLAHTENAPDEIATALIRMQQQIRVLSDDIHAIARQLHPSILDDLGLDEAVAAACSKFSEHEGITLKYSSDKIPDGLDSEIALNIYRIVQEALSNVAKHAKASEVTISIDGKNEAIHLRVIDDGAGFERTDLRKLRGLGLASIRERVDLIHGALTIKTAPGKGTEIRVVVPLPGGGTHP